MARSSTTPGRRPECTEADCDSPEVAHAFSLDCVAIGCTCARSGAASAGVGGLTLGQPIGSAPLQRVLDRVHSGSG